MKNFLFLMTHVGSDVSQFRRALTQHPDIDFFQSPSDHIYDGYDSLDYLSKRNHKAAHAAAIYMDQIEHNHRFQKVMLLPEIKFVFYLGDPRTSIGKTGFENPVRYYTYRLQGLYEYIVRTGGVVATHDNWKLEEISQQLNLRGELSGSPEAIEEAVDYGLASKAQKVYDDFLHKLKALDKVREGSN